MVRVIDVIFRIELHHSYTLINLGHHCYIKQTHKVSCLRGLCITKFLQPQGHHFLLYFLTI